jgi:ATP-binding cassette subfamily B protein RaxB
MVSQAHGLLIELAELRRRFPVSLKGASLQQLISNAAALQLSGRALRAEVDELDKIQLPCILHWNMNHFVVLRKVTRNHCVVVDPALGERRVSFSEVSRCFTGVALELSPTSTFEAADRRPRVNLSQLTGRVIGLKRSLVQIFLVALVLELFAIIAPLFNQFVIDDAISAHDTDLLSVLVLGFGLLLIIQAAIGLARSWMVIVLGQTLNLQWVANVFSHLIRLPIDFFERRHLGDVVSRFGAIGAIQKTLTTAVIESILDGIMGLLALVMMLIYAPQLACIVMASVAIYGMIRLFSYRAFREASAERLILSARENSHFLETMRAMVPLKLFGREGDRKSRWKNLVVEVQNQDVKIAKMNMAFSFANTLLFGIENLLVFWAGGNLVVGSGSGGTNFTVGMLMAFMSYKGQFTGRISALINYGVELMMLRLHSERLSDIVLQTPEKDDVAMNDLSHLEACIELRNVSFRYSEAEPWVLRDTNLFVAAGESIAITGESGCGKTTLLKILLGLLEPTEGEVLYGGIPVRLIGLANVRQLVGTVMQEDALLSGSLADNICFFDVQPDMARIEECARLAQLDRDIHKMPMGYHTMVGDLGTGLSGGQKQRLLLARALYKKPRVLALDEATSHLDLGNERAIAEALSHMSLTRVIIAHRPETIAKSERVVLIRQGMVADVEHSNAAATIVLSPAAELE